MSDNKYIIDKDSLTGIADAVRNKLGVGSSIDDENAGYYPTTGYVLKFNTIRKEVAGYGTNIIFSISNWNEQFKTWCGKVPEKIKFIRTTNSAYTAISCNGVEMIPAAGSGPVEKIISYPTNGEIVVTEYNGYNSYAVTPPAITIEFLDNDENSLGIINGDTSFSYDGETISFLTGSYNAAIPFTLNDIQNKITNIEGGIPPLTTVPTFKVYSGRSGGTSRINLSSYFSTQEEMLEHLVDVALGSPGNVVNGTTGAYRAGSYGRYPICKDKYGRWISMKKLGITLPSSLTYGYNSPATKATITNAHNNDLTFCFGTISPFSAGAYWIAIVDRYILLGSSDYIDYITDWYSVIVEV